MFLRKDFAIERVHYSRSEPKDFIQFLRENAPEGVKVDICINDKDYHELALHSELLTFAEILAVIFLAPTAVALLAKYLEKKFWPEKTDRNIKVNLIIAEKNKDQSKTIAVSYEGEVKGFKEGMKSAFEELRRNGLPIPDDTSQPKTSPKETASDEKPPTPNDK